MSRIRLGRVWTIVSAGVLVAALVALMPGSRTSQASPPGRVLRVFSLGGVLTNDGTLWQFRPDQGRWMTIDEAFKDKGKVTHILPLPVPATSVKDMVTFGFIQTETGACWLYDVDKDKWEELPPIPSDY
jgi:hypothetical protein